MTIGNFHDKVKFPEMNMRIYNQLRRNIFAERALPTFFNFLRGVVTNISYEGRGLKLPYILVQPSSFCLATPLMKQDPLGLFDIDNCIADSCPEIGPFSTQVGQYFCKGGFSFCKSA